MFLVNISDFDKSHRSPVLAYHITLEAMTQDGKFAMFPQVLLLGSRAPTSHYPT